MYIYNSKSNSNLFYNISIIHLIINRIELNTDRHNNFFIKCLKIVKKYNPSKNEYKFIYGILIQKALINLLNNIFYKCIDLDDSCTHGSEYKNDCRLYITKFIDINISIKAKKKKCGKTIIINKNSNNNNYCLKNLVSIIIIIELNDMLFLPHDIIPKKYIEDNKSNISYKSSLFTFIYKYDKYKKYILHLKPNNKFNIFYNVEYHNIKLHDLYKELYDNL